MPSRLCYSKKPADPEFLQLVPCAYDDDFAVAASPLRLLMPALSLLAVDSIAGLNLNHRTCFWVQYGSDRCQSPQTVVSFVR